MTAEKIAQIEAKQAAQERMISDVVLSLREVGNRMSESTTALLENTIEQRHSREAIARVHDRLDRHDVELKSINQSNDRNQPLIDLMRSMYNKVIMMIIGVMITSSIAVAGAGYVLTKGLH